MPRKPELVAYEGAVAQMHRAGKIAASKPQGMAFKSQLEVIASAMAANEMKYGSFKGGKV